MAVSGCAILILVLLEMDRERNAGEEHFHRGIFQQLNAGLTLAEDQGTRLNHCLCVAIALLVIIISVDYFIS